MDAAIGLCVSVLRLAKHAKIYYEDTFIDAFLCKVSFKLKWNVFISTEMLINI